MRIRAKFQGSAKKPYDVLVDTTKQIAWCSCPAMRWQKIPAPERSCKHTKPLLVMVARAMEVGAFTDCRPFFDVEIAEGTLTISIGSARVVAADARFAVLDLDDHGPVKKTTASFGRRLDLN